MDHNASFNPKQAAAAQKAYCETEGIPMFAPYDGICYLKRNYLNDHGYRGTLTRSLMEDPYIKCNLCNHTRTLKRLKAIGASDGCIKAYLECWEEYQKCENEI